MAVQILWTRLALSDLQSLREHISRDKPAAARKLGRAIRERVERLASHPASGRVVPELPGSDYREVIVPPCRVVYAYQDDTATLIVLRVWHGRRDLSRGW